MFGVVVFLVVSFLLVRQARLYFWLRGTTAIRRGRKGLVRIELRRRVLMEQLPEHVCQFPVPREERILVGQLLGFVLWHREESVGLPDAACTHLGDITPQEFDRAFPAWARVLGRAS